MNKTLTVFEWLGAVLLLFLVVPAILLTVLEKYQATHSTDELQQMQIDNLQRQINELPGYFERTE